MATGLDSVSDIERELAGRRFRSDRTRMRTNVMTHIAWVPEEWVEAAEDVLTGLAERHPSRTIVLFPAGKRPVRDSGPVEGVPGEQGGSPGEEAPLLEGEVSLDSFSTREGRSICTETIRIQLRGTAAEHPASVVQPLLIADLPVFLRWRGLPPFGATPFEELIGTVDRLIVDSTEWPGLPAPYSQLAEIFDRVAVSDIAWARTSRWRAMLASLWPEIADVKTIRVQGTAAQACLLGGWLCSRLGHDVAIEHEPSPKLVSVELDGMQAPFPPGDPPAPADQLSDELDRLSRDRVYEAAVAAAA